MMHGLIELLLLFCAVSWVASEEVCCEPSGECFNDDPPFDGLLWPLPECHTPAFTLWRSDMAEPENITRDSVPEGYVPEDVTVYLIGGWQNIGQPEQDDLRDAFLNSSTPYNVIQIDWTDGATGPYRQSASNVRVNGAEIADINALLAPDYSWCIGHSLGAHSCGHAGKLGAGLNRITGLDPTGPQFDEEGCLNQTELCRLDPSDAPSVDAIHGDGDLAGTTNRAAQMDFYPNGGLDQPGCAGDDFSEYCSHLRTYEYFIVSLSDDCFTVTQNCTDELDLPASCGPCDEGGCPSMGASATGSSGIFYLETSADSPYCLG